MIDRAREQHVASSLPSGYCISCFLLPFANTQHKQPKEGEYLLWVRVPGGSDHNDFVWTSQWQEQITEDVFHLVVDRKQGEGSYQKRLGPIYVPRILPPVASYLIWLLSSNNAVMLWNHQGIITLPKLAASYVIVSENSIRHIHRHALGTPRLSLSNHVVGRDFPSHCSEGSHHYALKVSIWLPGGGGARL